MPNIVNTKLTDFQMVSHFKIFKKLTEITQFSQELFKKVGNGGKNSKMAHGHLGKLFLMLKFRIELVFL